MGYPRADVLLVEKLAGLIPDAERERGINRALAAWNRSQLVERLKEMAADAGLKVFEVPPYGTSQICSKCGTLGRRYSIVFERETGKPAIHFGWVEKLFACPNADCPGRDRNRPEQPFTCNADHNASINIHRCFVLEDRAVEAFRGWKAKSRRQQQDELVAIENALQTALEKLHGFAGHIDNPF